jgi:hypothetical protein
MIFQKVQNCLQLNLHIIILYIVLLSVLRIINKVVCSSKVMYVLVLSVEKI